MFGAYLWERKGGKRRREKGKKPVWGKPKNFEPPGGGGGWGGGGGEELCSPARR